MEIGKIIKTVREAKGLSQKDLIDTANLGASMYSRIERGKTEPSITTLEKIAKSLGIKLSELFAAGDSVNDVSSVDKPLMEKVKLIESLSKEEKKIIFSVVDAFISKKKLKNVLENVLKEAK